MDVRRVLPEVSEEGSSLHWHPRSGQRLQEGIRVMADGGRDCGRMSPSPAGEGRSFISHWCARQLMASAAGIPAGKKVNPDLLFRLFLRSKSLVQDSTREPNCHAIRACPAAFPPPFLFPESAPSAEMMPVHHQEDAAAIALASACWHRQALALCRRLLTSSAWREAVDARRQG